MCGSVNTAYLLKQFSARMHWTFVGVTVI
uniref:Uncharacterized protein n=1 Tax=Rhizophora mucronata TaxID=61149 RepID=A0A2P2NDB5_RHIMU